MNTRQQFNNNKVILITLGGIARLHHPSQFTQTAFEPEIGGVVHKPQRCRFAAISLRLNDCA